ncbi:hypothetical protein BC940DRAFT_323077 [Gongronella butleri]|nr:hypothetical protein BC940DRAFT_323077 [Gongronella butleri]
MATLYLLVDRVHQQLYRYKVRIEGKPVEIKADGVVCLVYEDKLLSDEQNQFLLSFFKQIAKDIKNPYPPYNKSEEWCYFRPTDFDFKDGMHTFRPDGTRGYIAKDPKSMPRTSKAKDDGRITPAPNDASTADHASP